MNFDLYFFFLLKIYIQSIDFDQRIKKKPIVQILTNSKERKERPAYKLREMKTIIELNYKLFVLESSIKIKGKWKGETIQTYNFYAGFFFIEQSFIIYFISNFDFQMGLQAEKSADEQIKQKSKFK